MPCVRIATGMWATGSETKLLEAVQAALVSAFHWTCFGKVESTN